MNDVKPGRANSNADQSNTDQVQTRPNDGPPAHRGCCSLHLRHTDQCSAQQLGGLLGMSGAEAMLSIGFRLSWIDARVRDGTKFMLVLFPEAEEACVTAHVLKKYFIKPLKYGKLLMDILIQQLVPW